MSFDTYYDNNPWEGLSTNQRDWYVPALRELYLQKRVYNNFVSTRFQLAGAGSPVTNRMVINSVIPPHANFNQIGLRQLWMVSSYTDAASREITFNRLGGKFALHKFDDMITYWQKNGKTGLLPIINQYISEHMMEVLEMQARNAFLKAPYAYYAGGATNFNTLDAWDDHHMTTEVIKDINLGFQDRGVPFNQLGPNGAAPINPICVTSPGVLHDLRSEGRDSAGVGDSFLETIRYADPGRALTNEIGMYHGVRFITTPRAILWNSGAISVQSAISAPVTAGDGAPASKVDLVWQVGQPDATHYITVADATNFEDLVGQILTVHVARTSDFGVTNGVDHRDGRTMQLELAAVDVGNNRLSFKTPIMIDLTTDLGSSVYGYVTYGRHIHTSTFLGGMDGVVMGVGAPPQIYTPGAVDDFESMYRVSWDAYVGHQVFEPQVFEVAFSLGSNRTIGARIENPIAIA